MRSRVAIAADSHHGARPAHNAPATIKLLRTTLQRYTKIHNQGPLNLHQNGESTIAKTKTETNPNIDTNTDKNRGTNTKTKTYDV